MTSEQIAETKAEAKRFLQCVDEWEKSRGVKESGALRRSSMDLTRSLAKMRRSPFHPTPDTLKWLYHKMTDPSWAEWRAENGLPSSGEIQPCCGKAHPMNINGQDIADHKPMEEV